MLFAGSCSRPHFLTCFGKRFWRQLTDDTGNVSSGTFPLFPQTDLFQVSFRSLLDLYSDLFPQSRRGFTFSYQTGQKAQSRQHSEQNHRPQCLKTQGPPLHFSSEAGIASIIKVSWVCPESNFSYDFNLLPECCSVHFRVRQRVLYCTIVT